MDHSDSIVLTRRNKEFVQKPNTNLFSISTFCDPKDSLDHSGKCGATQGSTTDLHVTWLSNCEQTIYLIL